MEDYFNMIAVLSFVSKLHENMSDSAASLGVLRVLHWFDLT